MKWLVRTIAGLGVLSVALLAIGFVLPSQFRVERAVVINAPAEKIYALIAASSEWKRWTVWNQLPARIVDPVDLRAAVAATQPR